MADPASSPAVSAAERYVEVAVTGGKGKLADLFAEDAEFHDPEGEILSGREVIRAFYDRRLADLTPSFHIARVVDSGSECWVELAHGDRAAPELVSANHFTVGTGGLVTRLAVFLRPRST